MWPNRLLAVSGGASVMGARPAPHCPCSASAQRAGKWAVVFAQGVTHSEFQSSCLIVGEPTYLVASSLVCSLQYC